MTNPRKKKVYFRLYFAYAMGALLTYGLLMALVLPWWHVSNIPVVVTMGAGSAQPVALAYADDEEPLPLVPLGETEGYQWQWGTELPPRLNYDLELVFPEGTIGDVVLKKVEAFHLTPGESEDIVSLAKIEDTDVSDIQIKKLLDGTRLVAEPGARLPLSLEWESPGSYDWLLIWAKATFGFILVALVLFFTLSTCSQFPDRIQAYRRRVPAWEALVLLLFVLAGAFVHVQLTRHAMPVYTPGESDAYLLHAVGTNPADLQIQYPVNRPAYPLFLNAVGIRSGWDMAEVAVVQSVIFCAALALLAFSMVRLVRAPILGPVTFLAFLSPPALWASRHIGTESLTTSSWLLCLGLFLFLWKREGWQRWLGFVLFGLGMVVANSIHSSALVLLVLPLGLLFGTLIWSVVIRGIAFWRLAVFWRTFGQVSIPLVMLVAACTWLQFSGSGLDGLCSRAPRHSSAPFSSGMFEVRALLDSESYAEIINERALNGYRFDGPSMAAYPGLASRSAELLPWRARFVAWGRLSLWGILLPDIETYSDVPLRTDYQVRNRFSNASLAEDVRESLTLIMRETGQLVHVPEKHSSQQMVAYNRLVLPVYGWFYRVLMVLGLAGWFIGLVDRKVLAAALVLPFSLNLLLNVYTLSISSHSIQCLDALLWMGALAGLLCVNPKAMQRATDESDRRTMRPIRPKRLFTPHTDVKSIHAD